MSSPWKKSALQPQASLRDVMTEQLVDQYDESIDRDLAEAIKQSIQVSHADNR